MVVVLILPREYSSGSMFCYYYAVDDSLRLNFDNVLQLLKLALLQLRHRFETSSAVGILIHPTVCPQYTNVTDRQTNRKTVVS